MQILEKYQNFDSSHRQLLTRLLVFSVFALLIYQFGYLPLASNNLFVDTLGLIKGTIRAANEGHYFMTYSLNNPSHLLRFEEIANGYYDPGFSIIVSSSAFIGRFFLGDSFTVTTQTLALALYLLFIVTAAAFLFPSIPLPVSIGGVIALAIGTTFLPMGANGFTDYHWGAGYAAIILGMVIATIYCGKFDLAFNLVIVIFGCLLGFSQLIRNESTVLIYVVAGVALVSLWGAVLLAQLLRESRWREITLPLAKRGTVGFAIIILFIFIFPLGLHGLYAAAWQIPISDVRGAMHGEGHNLYLSLGYISNPYNISWRDQVAIIYSKLISPNTTITSSHYHQVLRDEWLHIIKENPWLLLNNTFAKIKGLNQTLLSMPIVSIFYALFCLLFLVGGLLVVWRRNYYLVITYYGVIGLALAGAATPILIYPSYNAAFQGTILICTFLLPACLLYRLRDPNTNDVSDKAAALKRLGTFLVVIPLILSLITIVGLASWIQIRSAQYQTELDIFENSDPLATLQKLGFRFEHFFNDLPVDEQEKIIQTLKNSANPDVGSVVTDVTSAQPFFRPVLGVYAEDKVYLFAWLGKPGLKDGEPTASSFLKICTGCDQWSDYLANTPYEYTEEQVDRQIMGINNADWQDRYRVYTFEVDTPREHWIPIKVGLQKIVAFNAQNISWRLTTLVTATLK